MTTATVERPRAEAVEREGVAPRLTRVLSKAPLNILLC